MSHARAAVAGMLSAVLLVLVIHPTGSRSPDNLVIALLSFVGIIAILVGVDVVHTVRGITHRHDEEDE